MSAWDVGGGSARGRPFCGGLSTSVGTCARAGRRLSGADLSHTVESKPPRMPRRAGDPGPRGGSPCSAVLDAQEPAQLARLTRAERETEVLLPRVVVSWRRKKGKNP